MLSFCTLYSGPFQTNVGLALDSVMKDCYISAHFMTCETTELRFIIMIEQYF